MIRRFALAALFVLAAALLTWVAAASDPAAWGATANGATWRGLAVAPENRCSPYVRRHYGYSQSIRQRILSGETGESASPYSGIPFAAGGRWDIEHVVATSEAHDSGLCAADRRARGRFARDMRNLTLARPRLNRHQKRGHDAAEWMPDAPAARCWFARRTVEVKRAWNLAVDRDEASALDEALAECGAAPDG